MTIYDGQNYELLEALRNSLSKDKISDIVKMETTEVNVTKVDVAVENMTNQTIGLIRINLVFPIEITKEEKNEQS